MSFLQALPLSLMLSNPAGFAKPSKLPPPRIDSVQAQLTNLVEIIPQIEQPQTLVALAHGRGKRPKQGRSNSQLYKRAVFKRADKFLQCLTWDPKCWKK